MFFKADILLLLEKKVSTVFSPKEIGGKMAFEKIVASIEGLYNVPSDQTAWLFVFK